MLQIISNEIGIILTSFQGQEVKRSISCPLVWESGGARFSHLKWKPAPSFPVSCFCLVAHPSSRCPTVKVAGTVLGGGEATWLLLVAVESVGDSVQDRGGCAFSAGPHLLLPATWLLSPLQSPFCPFISFPLVDVFINHSIKQ